MTTERMTAIELYPRRDIKTTCVACGGPARNDRGLLVDSDGEVVENDYEGEWVGMPPCYACWAIHDAGGVRALDFHLDVLRAKE